MVARTLPPGGSSSLHSSKSGADSPISGSREKPNPSWGTPRKFSFMAASPSSSWSMATAKAPAGTAEKCATAVPPEIATSPDSPFLQSALKEGVLYIPGEFGHVAENGDVPTSEARLSFGDATPDQIREGVRRLRRAADLAVRGREPATV